MTTETFTINVRQLGDVRDTITKLANKARKRNLPEPRIESISEPRTITVKKAVAPDVYISLTFNVVDVEVVAETLKIDGWLPVATLTYEHSSPTIYVWPGEKLPLRFRESKSTQCDHCGHARQRKQTFVLRRDARSTRTFMQVGSTCVKDFIGIDPIEFMKNKEAWATIASMHTGDADWDEHEFSFGGVAHDTVLEVLTVTAMHIRRFGWTAKSKADEQMGVYATAQLVEGWLGSVKRQSENPIEAQDVAVAEAALESVLSISQTKRARSDYLYNLHNIASDGWCSSKEMGLTVSMVAYYIRERDNAAQRKAERKGMKDEYLGELKERRLFTGKLIACRHMDSQYGVKTLLKFVDEGGRVFVWWCTAHGHEWTVGDTYTLKGTVREHGVYQDQKQTTITRCVVVE